MPNPDLIPEPFAQSGDKNTIPLERAISDPIYRASWKAGFPPDTRLPKDVGGEAPDGLDFNGLFNALSQAVVFLQKGNAYQFDVSMAPYPIGALVRSNDDLTTFQNTIALNSNNPNTNMSGWRIYNGSGFIVDNLTTNDSAKALSAAQGKVLQDNKLESNKVGAANGVASLDANTKVPVAQLPAASTSASGAVQLNNTLTSVSTAQALTAAQGKVLQDGKLGLTANAVSATKLQTARAINNVLFDGTADINLPLIGYGQTWKNVTTSRSAGVNYTNTTPSPINILLSSLNYNGAPGMDVYVNNVLIGSISGSDGFNQGKSISLILPPQQFVKVNGGFQIWSELS